MYALKDRLKLNGVELGHPIDSTGICQEPDFAATCEDFFPRHAHVTQVDHSFPIMFTVDGESDDPLVFGDAPKEMVAGCDFDKGG